MTNRERALQIAENMADRLDRNVENLGPEFDYVNERLWIATILALADISERLEDLNDNLEAIYIDGVGIEGGLVA